MVYQYLTRVVSDVLLMLYFRWFVNAVDGRRRLIVCRAGVTLAHYIYDVSFFDVLCLVYLSSIHTHFFSFIIHSAANYVALITKQ